MSDPRPLRTAVRAEDGALSAGFMVFLVASLAGIFFFVQLGHANVLATEATTAADAAALAGAVGVRDHIALETHLGNDIEGQGEPGGPICGRTRAWAQRNGAEVIDCDVEFQFLRQQLAVEVTVRGDEGPVGGPSDELTELRPETRSRAELRYRFVDLFEPFEPDIALAPLGGSEAWRTAPLVDLSALLGSGEVPPSADGMAWPVCHVVTSEAGPRWGREHTGIDQGSPLNSTVRASLDGRVSFVGWGGGYGNLVIIDHADGVQTYYAHLVDGGFRTSVGTTVEQGDEIGRSGTTGNSTGPHLHFETRVNGKPQNPRSFLGQGAPCSAPPSGGEDAGDEDD